MPRVSELLIALGAAQSDISTISASFTQFSKLNRVIAAPAYRKENDAAWLGKGDEFPTQEFKSHIDGPIITLEKYCCVEFLNYVLPKVLGHTSTLTYTPSIPVTDGEELPYLTYVEQMRPGGSAVRDIAWVGCAIKSFRISLNSGPGLASSKITIEIVPCGLITEASGVTMPAISTETLLAAYSAAFVTLTVDYVTLKNFVSCEFGWDNNLVPRYYPGSGQQDGYQVAGALEIGDRAPIFSFSARYANGSTELTKVRDLTTGTAAITLTNGTKSASFTFQKLAFAAAEFGDDNGKVTVNVTGTALKHATNGVLTAVMDIT